MNGVARFVNNIVSSNVDLIIIMLTAIIITSSISIVAISLHLYFDKKENEGKKRDKIAKSHGKKYVLNTIRIGGDGKKDSSWHGWNTGQWLFTYEEALERKEKINHLFNEVEIIEHGLARRSSPRGNGGLEPSS